jgi:hypothetical protein
MQAFAYPAVRFPFEHQTVSGRHLGKVIVWSRTFLERTIATTLPKKYLAFNEAET